MRHRVQLTHLHDEVGGIVALVGADGDAPAGLAGDALEHRQGGEALGRAGGARQLGIDDEPVAVLHERVPHEAEHRAGAEALAEQPGVRVGGRGMRLVRAALAAEVHLGIAAGA